MYTHDLVSTMLRQSPETFVPLHFQDIFTSHQSTYNTVHSVSEALGKSHVQHIFSQVVWNARLKTLLDTANLQSQARLQGLGMAQAGAFITAFPIPSMAQRISDSRLFRLMIRRHLGLPLLLAPSVCTVCSATFDVFGHRALNLSPRWGPSAPS